MLYTLILISMFVSLLLEKLCGLKIHRRSNGKVTFSIFCVVLIVLSACRYQNVHSDFLTNYNHVIRMYSVSWNEVFKQSDIGQALLRKISANIFHDPQWYFLLSSLIIIYCFAKNVKEYSPNAFMSVFLYYTIGGYFSSNNITRQAVAGAFVMIAWRYVIEQKIWKFLSIMLIAFSFHKSVIFFIPMYFLCTTKFNPKQLFVYSIVGAIIMLFRRQIISVFQIFVYSEYSFGSDTYGTSGSDPINLIFVAVFMFYLVLLLNNKNNVLRNMEYLGIKHPEYFFNFLSHSVVLYCFMTILSVTSMLLFSRLSMYWRTQTALTALFAVVSSKRKGNKYALMFVLVLVGILWFAVNNFMGKLIPTPYTPFWHFPNRLTL